ncbi:TIGR00289 family protein [Candidatus Bathyarchaeota archaeon]|nr:TIGR00289 family protein [Candidatus Bathyarchaeota archaeon]
MELAALVTGGKDSALALYKAMRKHSIKYLAAMVPQREDSWMFHYPNIHMVDFFAEAAEIPLVKAETAGVKEAEVEDLKNLLAKLDVEGVVSGAVASTYQKTRIDKICQELNLRHIAPLWHEKPEKILNEIIENEFEVIIVGVYALGLNENWLGRKIDTETVKELIKLKEKFGISPVGEGGEYESLVLDAPYFKKKIQILETEKVWKENQGYLMVKKAELIPK